jgi:hypothetical protein
MSLGLTSMFLLVVGCGVLAAAVAALVYVLLTQREK